MRSIGIGSCFNSVPSKLKSPFQPPASSSVPTSARAGIGVVGPGILWNFAGRVSAVGFFEPEQPIPSGGVEATAETFEIVDRGAWKAVLRIEEADPRGDCKPGKSGISADPETAGAVRTKIENIGVRQSAVLKQDAAELPLAIKQSDAVLVDRHRDVRSRNVARPLNRIFLQKRVNLGAKRFYSILVQTEDAVLFGQ